MLRRELPPPPAGAAEVSSPGAASPVAAPSPVSDGSEPRRMRKCQTCDNIVDENDSYRVFSLPSCDACTEKYVHGGGQRALILGGIFAASLVAFALLVFFFDVLGRAVGALVVLFAFYVVLHTGAQYDVDVERQRGARLDIVRRAGFFKKWGDLDSKWWGKWLLRRGLYAVLGAIAWFVPIGASAASSSNEKVADMPELKKTVLKPLGPGVDVNGKTVSLIEVVATDESLACVLEIGGKQQHVPAGDVEKVLEDNGLVLLDAALPPEPPSLTVAKKSDLPKGWDD
jgi:hypothetical protein